MTTDQRRDPCSRRTLRTTKTNCQTIPTVRLSRMARGQALGPSKVPGQPGGDDPGECGHRQRGRGPGAENPAAGVLRQRSRVEVGRHACRSGRVCPGGRVGHGCSLLCVGQIDASTLGALAGDAHRQKAAIRTHPRRRFRLLPREEAPRQLAQYVHDVRSRWFLPRTYGLDALIVLLTITAMLELAFRRGLTEGAGDRRVVRRRGPRDHGAAARRAATLPVRRSGGVLGVWRRRSRSWTGA